MLSDRVFQIAFLISLLAHTAILFQKANLNLFPNHNREEKLEISYVKELEKKSVYTKPTPDKKDLPLDLPSNIVAKKRLPPPFIDKQDFFKKSGGNKLSELAVTKPSLIKPDIIAIKKKITLPPIGIDKINNSSYIGYYQIVREKIKRAAYHNYTRIETGEAYLSFIISNDGYLKEVRISEEKSSSNQYLKEIALRSIKEASPFPVFPKELDYPQLSFNVVISFEIE